MMAATDLHFTISFLKRGPANSVAQTINVSSSIPRALRSVMSAVRP